LKRGLNERNAGNGIYLLKSPSRKTEPYIKHYVESKIRDENWSRNTFAIYMAQIKCNCALLAAAKISCSTMYNSAEETLKSSLVVKCQK